MKKLIQNFIVVILILIAISGIFAIANPQMAKSTKEISLSELTQSINQEKIEKISVNGNDLSIQYKGGDKAISRKEADGSLSQSLLGLGASSEQLQKIDIKVEKEKSGTASWLIPLLSLLIPVIIFAWFFFMIFKQAKSGGNQTFNFLKAPAKLFGDGKNKTEKVTFKDIAGIEEAKDEIKEVVDFLKNPQKYQQIGARIPRGVLLIGPPGTGKCIVGDSLIFTSKGLVEIQEIPKYFSVDPKTNRVYGAKLPIIDLKPLRSLQQTASHWYDLGKQKTIKITLQQGLNLEGTPEHPIIVLNEQGELLFKPLAQIKENDQVALKFNTQSFGSLQEIDSEKAYVMGLLTGDGNLSYSNRIGLTTTDQEIINSFQSYIHDRYGEDQWIGKATDGITQTVTSWKVKKDFYNAGMSYLLSYDKTIPATILQAPKQTIVAFLQGLFDADGYFERYNFGFSTVSKKLSDQILVLLLNFGIVAYRRIKANLDSTHPRPVYEITVSGIALKTFTKEIGFRLSRKQEQINKYLNTHKIGNTNVDVFPYIVKKIEKQWKILSQQKLSNSYLAIQIDKIRKRGRVSRNTLAIFLKFFKENGLKNQEVSYLQALYDTNLFFTPVTQITAGENKVYDFTVPKYHSFVANGLVNHNTLLARAVANEAGVAFFSISGSEFVELFVGVGSARVRSLFETAKKNPSAIVFIDEIDSIGKIRGVGLGGGHDEREQTLNQILAEMDGFEKDTGVIVMAASVSGDTPVLTKQNNHYKLAKIEEIIDPFYQQNEEGIEKLANGLEILGFDKKMSLRNGNTPKNNTYFQNSNFKKVRSVFRHKVDSLYVIEFNGGKIKTTGNHSLFVATNQGIKPKMVADMKTGDILVNLPYKANRTAKKLREIRAHNFQAEFSMELSVWQPLFGKFEFERDNYEYAINNSGLTSQAKIAEEIGSTQTTIGRWQRGLSLPRPLSRNYFQHQYTLPEKVKVSPQLMHLLGYYTSEGYARKEVDFCLNIKEKDKIAEIQQLMKEVFNLEPNTIRQTINNAVNIVYNCKPLAEFFSFHCGKGAHNKHVPNFLFETPFEYFQEFLRGCFQGDGYFDKRGKGELTSVSKQLILELNWLSRMHGFKSYIHSFKTKEGRVINNGKPLAESIAWRLGFGKTQNPFDQQSQSNRLRGSVERAIVKKITQIPYEGFVYDFCGCENEAFFAGESPILAHNTNRPEYLDPALLRPGRFDRRIILDLPDVKGREEILKIHTKDKPLANNVNLVEIAERTPGFSGADLANLVNEAAIFAARRNKDSIGQTDFLESFEKVLLGPERKSHLLSQKEKERAAYHEAGHALISATLPNAEEVRKVSIVARGMAAGFTLALPKQERKMRTKLEFLAELSVLLAGYCAEQTKFGEISTGASNDLEKASALARGMVTKYGMSIFGPMSFGKRESMPFLGWETEAEKNYSDKTADQIDKETEKFIKEAEVKTMKLLQKKKPMLEKIAKVLIEKETIEKEEFDALVNGGKVKKEKK